MEYTDALGKFLPDQDRPNEGVFSFQDDDEQWLSLRYDLTAPLARYVAENFDALPKPYRSYRAGYVFRNEKPGPGRFRQFMQFDADTVGSDRRGGCRDLHDGCRHDGALGIKRGDYVVKVNNRKVLDGVMEASGLAARRMRAPADRAARDRQARPVRPRRRAAVLGDGRKDEAGDFTKGAGLGASDRTFASRFVEWRVARRSDRACVRWALRRRRPLARKAPRNLRRWSLIAAAGYADRVVSIPPWSAASNITPARSTRWNSPFETKDERPPRALWFGRRRRTYDGLVWRFRASRCRRRVFRSACRGCRRRLRAGQARHQAGLGPVVVTVFGGEIADYQRWSRTLRNAKIRAELYLGNPKHSLGQQMKYADGEMHPAQSSRARRKGRTARCRSRT